MSKEKIDYNNYVLDPNKDVLVPMATYLALTNVIQEVERKHSKRIRTDKYAWFNKVTHERLSPKGKAKMDTAKLHKEYYENIDFDATAKNIRVDRDELGSAAIELLAEFRGIFKRNVDLGNAMLRPEQKGPQAVQAPKVEAPQTENAAPVESASEETVEQNES